ncbi:hypothetical protein [Microbacterium sp. NPDC056052]|uniref:hypothetical protein n=1 Tax=Microbacterium sp. NPDC056052 TaxID=3345695 RepID=UPI0035DBD5E9
MSASTVCPPSHSHGAAQTCYNKHRCRCEACKANAVAVRVQHKADHRRRRAASAQRFEDIPFTPIQPCVGEDAARVRRAIAKRAESVAERLEFEAMLGVPA